jgi:hypothetical protein
MKRERQPHLIYRYVRMYIISVSSKSRMHSLDSYVRSR